MTQTDAAIAAPAPNKMSQVPPPQPPRQETPPANDRAAKIEAGQIVFVIDTTAVPTSDNPDGVRTHTVEVNGMDKRFVFKPDEPKELPKFVAAKFLKHEGFIRVDEEGNQMPWEDVPKQPDELAAGEKFRLEANQTIARLDELTNEALAHRAALLPRGDVMLNQATRREEVVNFILDAEKKRRVENTRPENDDPDMYTPPPLTGLDDDEFEVDA